VADGRTTWWGKDGRWWGRERVVLLGQEFGCEGPAVLDWLSCEAQLQRDGGAVKTGYAAVAHGCFASVERVRAVVVRAAEIGALDDFVEHGLTFTARVSGWVADQAAIRAAERQAKKRAQDHEDNHGESRSVTVRHAESPTRPDQTSTTNEDKSSPSEIDELFAYWQQQCGHPNATLSAERRRKIAGRLREGFKPQQIREAIDGAARGAFVNETGRRFDDIELICRNASKLESFIGRPAAKAAKGTERDERRARGAAALEMLRGAV
jgi:hypothetical protein